MKKDIWTAGWRQALCSLAAAVLWAAGAGAAEFPRARVAFDRQGGFTVQQGEEASIRARVEGGGGYWFSAWESDNAGVVAGAKRDTFVLDTSMPGTFRARVCGGCDGTDRELTGIIRFRVAAKGTAAARAAGEGESVVWSEDFTGLDNVSTSTSTEITSYTGNSGTWEAGKMFNLTNAARIGSSKATGYAKSPVATLGGNAGRVEFSMWACDSAAVVKLDASTDGGTSWSTLETYTNLPAETTNWSVVLPAAQSVRLCWTNSAVKHRFYLDDVSVYASGSGGGSVEDQPPTIDLDPASTNVTLAVGETYELEVTATEYLGKTVVLEATTLPDGALWSSAESGTGSVSGTFTWEPDETGSYTAVFEAMDEQGRTAEVTVTFTVEPEGPGTLAFLSTEVYARENSTATLTVQRTGGAAGAVTVAWATANGTATAGSDYTAASGTLSFADGEASKSLTVAVLNDSSAENNETFTVTLSNPTGGAALGTATVCTVTIVDDDDANADYYASCYSNGALKTGDALKSALHRIVNTSTNHSGIQSNTYAQVMTILKTIDIPPGESKVRCLYSQAGITAYNREHIWAQSHGIDEKLPGYTDLHHIRLCTETFNSARNDKDFDNCKGLSGASSIGTTSTGTCYYTSNAFEPPDAAKGDVARACLYMAVRYQGQYGTQVSLELVDSVGTSKDGNQLGKLSTLLAWNELDPPDAFETNRNELIYSSYQYNRNPFIDHYKWARAVFDPSNYVPETVTWTINVTVEGNGTVNSQSSDFTVPVTNGSSASFGIQPNTWEYYHIGSVSTNGTPIAMGYDSTNYLSFTWSNISDNGTLAVVFDPDLASRGTPIPWLVQYGYTNDWDAAELDDPNDDGVPNWQEYLNGTDPTALSLRQVTGVTVTEETMDGFTVSWNTVDYADGYQVRVCSTAVVEAATAGFEGGEADSGWTVSEAGATAATNAALDGTYGMAFSTNGAWLCSPAVTDPAAVEFKYKRSGNTNAWTLEVEVSANGGTSWSNVATVADASSSVKTNTTDLSAWYGQTVLVRLRDTRESGNAARYVDAVIVKSGGATVAEATPTATAWTATGLDAGTGYDVFVRGEATTLGTAVGPWSQAVRATTTADASGRQAQSITFPAIADQIVGATVTLDATATSGLEVAYSWSGPATLSGNVLACTDTGTVTVTASQAGNEEWAPAADVSRSFAVMAAPVELAAPASVWAAATNMASFTAEWSAVEGAEGYELNVWTAGGTQTVVTTNGTMLFSNNFESVTGDGSSSGLSDGFIEGWTCVKAYGGTNEIKVGASGTPGSVTAAPVGATGTVRVVTWARAWSGDTNAVMWVGVTGCASQPNTLTNTTMVFTNDFEDIAGSVTVCWSNTAGNKRRFFLEAVSASEITVTEESTAGTVPVPGYEALAVPVTSCIVTGLTASTEYSFKVRALAGGDAGPWSGTASATTTVEDEPVEPEPTEQQEKYETWVAGLGLASTEGLEYATAKTTDSDNDGATNWQEYLADTDPTDSGKFLRLAVERQADGTWIARPEPARTNRSYSLVTRTDLTDDSTLSTNSSFSGLGTPIDLPEGGGVWFGTVRVALPE